MADTELNLTPVFAEYEAAYLTKSGEALPAYALEKAFGVAIDQIDGQFASWFRAGVPPTSKIRPGPREGGTGVEKELPVTRELPRPPGVGVQRELPVRKELPGPRN